MGKIIGLLLYIADLVTKMRKIFSAQKLIDAKDESLAERDQRKLEQSLGGEGGMSSVDYARMFERERKKPK